MQMQTQGGLPDAAVDKRGTKACRHRLYPRARHLCQP
jgi:hypothetical protein